MVIARYNLPIAQTDVLRTRAGGQVRGVNTGVVQGTPGGGAGGAGAGTGAGGTSSGAGGAGAGAPALSPPRWARAPRSPATTPTSSCRPMSTTNPNS